MSADIPAPHTESLGASSVLPTTSTSVAPGAATGTSAATATSSTVPPVGASVGAGADALPKPVTPAEAIPAAPAKALDPIVGEPTILDKAQALAKPYLEKVEPYAQKVQDAAKPYADKAAAKTKEIIDKIEGNSPSTSPVPTSANTVERSTDSASATTSEVGEKAKGIFEQGLSAVQSTFTQITHTIDEKTASPTHPGFITQVTNAVHKGVEKVEKAFNEATDAPATTAPAGTTGTGTAPTIPTTTNTLPHPPL
ncbi:hypothetical protein IAU59_005781 [Kwoniella sp. CBS 9459]